jgi:hypothetical protein
MNKIKKQQKKVFSPKKVEEPIGSRIAKAVYNAKKISERIFGFISYDIKFVRASYNGKTQRPAKITALEKGVVGILLRDKTSSLEKIGTILGLDVVNDKAEEAILRSAILTLRSFNAIEGDDSLIALTDNGRAYADKGERPDSYTKEFDLFIDMKHPSWVTIKNGIGENVKYIKEINTPCDDLALDIETIRTYAEQQAQDVHYPQNRYLLESATWINGHDAEYKIYVCFVQNVANSEEVRAFVYDENAGSLNNTFAEYINSDNVLKEELLSNCIRIECENDEETTVLEGDAVEVAKAQIPAELKEAEQKMIEEESDNDSSDDDESEVATDPIIESKTKSKTDNKNRLHKKALYDSLSFEIEIQKIFTEDNPDEVWLISPWIRKGAFLRERGPMIENFLKDEKKRVFIAYSEPAENNDGRPMIDEEVEPGIKLLEEQYPNFFYVQLPEFHLKNVIEVKGEQTVLFSGSFNVLSFSVSDKETHVRREEMALAHHTVAKKKYDDCRLEFAKIYSDRIKKQIENLESSEIENYRNERLDYFLSIENAEVHKLFSPIEDLLEEKNLSVIVSKSLNSLTLIGKQLVAAVNMGGLNAKDKKKLAIELSVVEKVLSENSVDDPATKERLSTTKELFEKVPLKQIFPGNDKSHQRMNREKVISAPKEDNAPSFSLDEKALNIINGNDPTNEKEALILLLSLCFAFSRRLIVKKDLQDKLRHIVIDYSNLYSDLAIESSMNNDEASDVTIAVLNYSIKFKTLFLASAKRAYEQQVKTTNIDSHPTWVTPRNVESILVKLLK